MSDDKALEIELNQSSSSQELVPKIAEIKDVIAAAALPMSKVEKVEAQTVTKQMDTTMAIEAERQSKDIVASETNAEKTRSCLAELKRFRVIRKHEVLKTNTTDRDMECSPAKHFKLDNLMTERKSIIEIHLKNESTSKPNNNLQESMSHLKEQCIIELDKIREQHKLQEQSTEKSDMLRKLAVEMQSKDDVKASQDEAKKPINSLQEHLSNLKQQCIRDLESIRMQKKLLEQSSEESSGLIRQAEENQKNTTDKQQKEMERENENNFNEMVMQVSESKSETKTNQEQEPKSVQQSELEPKPMPEQEEKLMKKSEQEQKPESQQEPEPKSEQEIASKPELEPEELSEKRSNECIEKNEKENIESFNKLPADNINDVLTNEYNGENKTDNNEHATKEAAIITEEHSSNEENKKENDKRASKEMSEESDKLLTKATSDKPFTDLTFDKTARQSYENDGKDKEEYDKVASKEAADRGDESSKEENNKLSTSSETEKHIADYDDESSIKNSKPVTMEMPIVKKNHTNEHDGENKIENDKTASIETTDGTIAMDVDGTIALDVDGICIKSEKPDSVEEKSEANVVIETHEENTSMSITAEEDTQQPPEQLSAAEELLDRQLRASCESFLQHLPCFKLQQSKVDNKKNGAAKPSVPKCRECRRRSYQNAQASSLTNSDVYCRFYEFRRLQYNTDGELLVAGFPNPYTDYTAEDLNIWQPDENTPPTAGYMDIQVCRYILLHAGDQFCYLWRQEAEALKLHENPNSTIAWKKVVKGVREICDVCDTTLFNFHWTCDKCGFGVCADCFKDRKEQRTCRKTRDKPQRGRDEFHWLLCAATGSPQQKHELCELMLTQIIAGDALNVLGRLLHDVRTLWQVPQVCGCLLSKQELPPDSQLSVFIQDMIKESQLKQQTSASSLATEETLRKQARMEKLHAKKLEFARARGIDYVPGRVWTKQTLGKDPITTAFDNFKHINFLRKGLAGLRRFLPPRAMTLAHSTVLAPGVPHEWLCDGKLLRLTNAMHPDNRILFQEVWKCGQPVMISEVARSLNLDLWRPEAFCRDFGDKPNDLINCLNGNLVPNQPMRHFWEGFQCIKKRLLDSHRKPMLLKLKDWPPGDDFAEILPTRYADLMKGLPMPEYTLRTGNLNIASCLPEMFVPPDLGPKMYNAYGSALHPDKGTTNLHLDISDAVNIMVYVGIPQDSDSKSQLMATQRAIAMGGCEYLTRARAISPHVLPGALWHIFPARDADKIRDLLNRVTLEKGFRLEPDHDPIHDQNWYLDDKLRARLFKEYGVEGYPIVQCLGDAVFIPAGAPHQVQNLHNCIKVAEDFVSPENITHCYHLTHEFRRLSHSHTNHEDKLQIKNIIYHAIKDCCTILVRALHQRIDAELALQAAQEAKLQMHADNAVDFISNLTTEQITTNKKAADESAENSM